MTTTDTFQEGDTVTITGRDTYTVKRIRDDGDIDCWGGAKPRGTRPHKAHGAHTFRPDQIRKA